MILEKLEKQKEFTGSEQAIASYLLQHPGKIAQLSTAELAAASHTSKPTVTRLCKKLGYTAYREFQADLQREQAELQRIHARISAEPIHADTSYEEIQRILPVLYDNAISSASLRMEKDTICRAVRRLRAARKIDLYGSGVTNAVAQLSAFKFSTLGLECATHSGLNEHYILADRHPQDKVVIVFSLTGGNPNMVHVCQWLKKRGYYILGIGGDTKEELPKLCTDYIYVPMEQNIIGMEIMKAFNMINYVVDVLFTLLVVKDYDHNRDVAVKLLQKPE